MNILVIATFTVGLRCAAIFNTNDFAYFDLDLGKDAVVDVYKYQGENLNQLVDNSHQYIVGLTIDEIERDTVVVCNQ